jgi:putative glycerol-1-phosphate prenyltransferase/phosphoglycerol geranylgeranyltransferase
VVAGADGILFTTMLSGRNPQYLVDEQVKGAPKALRLGIEPLPTAYLLIESGHPTTVQIVSGTLPLKPEEPESVLAHAQAAYAMGMRWVYLEAGSGAERPVPVDLVKQVAQVDGISVICGGGLRSAEAAGERARAGAAMIVTGNALEVRHDPQYLKAFATAIHR